jgi:hypothetical protein
LSGITASLDSLVAGATAVRLTVTFTLQQAFDADGKISMGIPSGFTVPAAPAALPLQNIAGTLSATAVGQLVTVTRSGGSQVAAGTAVSLRLSGLTNPTVSGTTAAFTALQTLTAAGALVDTADSLPAGFAITPGAFYGPSPTAALSSYAAGSTAVELTVTFTLGNSLPAAGAIELGLPAGFIFVVSIAKDCCKCCCSRVISAFGRSYR